MNLGPQTMSLPVSRLPGEVFSDQFPAGLRVLVVDDDPTCLMILEKMLQTCLYQVTTSNRAEKALSLLRENRNGYDIIISDVHMPDMDGFILLEHVGLEMDLPVIMMSADDSKNVVMKGITHGACDYLIKPVRMEALKNIWQHVIRKKKKEWKNNIGHTRSMNEGEQEQLQRPNEDGDYSSSANEGNNKNSKRRNEEDDDGEDREDSSSLKKPRVVWSVELHQQFMTAVDQLGVDKAVPKKILEMMNVPGLTRENVASHLQKYRLYLRRLSGSHHQAGLGNSFMATMNGHIDLQTLAASGQIPPQSLANLQAATLARSLPKSTIPILDQRNFFSFENPSKFRLGETNNSNNNSVSSNSNKQVNLLHGIPTTMEPQQLANFRGITMQTNPHNNGNNSHLSRLPNLLNSGFTSNGVLMGEGLGNVRGSAYNQFTQPSMVNFSTNQVNMEEGLVRNEVGSKGFNSSYDIFNNLAHHKTNDNWNLQNVGMSFESTPHVNLPSSSNSNGLNVQPSVLVHQGFSSGKDTFLNRNGNGNGNGNENGFGTLFGESSVRVKSEANQETSGQNMLFSDQFGHEGLTSAFYKQQEGLGQVPSDFGFDGFPALDNLPA